MKICLLGEYAGNLDEGMRKVSYHFAEELLKYHDVLTLDLRNAFTKAFWKSIKDFNPDIIHYIHGPSIKSFVFLKFSSLCYHNAKSVMSAMHPDFSFLSKRFIPLLKPDLILTQSYEMEKMFKELGFVTEFLPCGVDIKRFKPVTEEDKEDLRAKYEINKDKFVILHVGSIKDGRNVQLMEKLHKRNIQAVIVGAVSTGINKSLIQHLKEAGCLVLPEYFKNIEEIYALSNCYIFPTRPENRFNSIEIPLSVLEAMSCNLPVVTTKFGALPRIFGENDSFVFVDNDDDFINKLEKIKIRSIEIKTREMVLQYSWENIGKKLGAIYGRVIEG